MAVVDGELTAEQRAAFEARYHDLPWYAEHAPLRVLDKVSTNMVPMRMNVAQRYVIARQWAQARSGRRVQSLIPKFRQGGITTLGLSRLTHISQTRADRMMMLMLHDLELAEPMYDRLEKMHQSIGKPDDPNGIILPKAKITTAKTGRELGFDTGSLIQITTAGKQKGIGRGNTIHHVHATEIPSWPNPTQTMKGLMESVPELGMFEASIVLESTSEGVGDWWYWACMRASEGKGDFDLIFLPWWLEIAYGAADPKPWDLKEAWSRTSGKSLNDCLKVPLNEAEEDIGKRILKEGPAFGVTYLTPDMVVQKLLWRRRKIESITEDAEQTFMQEYPLTLAESFQGTGRPVFKSHSIAYHRARLADDGAKLVRPAPQRVEVYKADTIVDGMLVKQVWDGRLAERGHSDDGLLHVWKGFEEGERYIIGGDPSSGEADDPSAVQVCKVRPNLFEQVAVWHGWIGMVELAYITAWMAQRYGNALIVPEITGLGHEYVGQLARMRWPGRKLYHRRVLSEHEAKMVDRPGFDMQEGSRNAVIEQLYDLLQKEDMVIRHEPTLMELEQFRRDKKGRPDHPVGGHSDLMMALGVAAYARHQHGTPVHRPKRAQGMRYEAAKETRVRTQLHPGY